MNKKIYFFTTDESSLSDIILDILTNNKLCDGFLDIEKKDEYIPILGNLSEKFFSKEISEKDLIVELKNSFKISDETSENIVSDIKKFIGPLVIEKDPNKDIDNNVEVVTKLKPPINTIIKPTNIDDDIIKKNDLSENKMEDKKNEESKNIKKAKKSIKKQSDTYRELIE